MKRLRVKLTLAVVAAGALAIGIVTVAVAGGGHSIRERLTGTRRSRRSRHPGSESFGHRSTEGLRRSTTS
jgi:hypothetical protein